MGRARTGVLRLCLWAILWLPWPGFAQEIGVAWLEDATGSLAVADLAQPAAAARFRATRENPLNFGLSRSAYWLRFEVPPGGGEWLIEVATPYLDYLEFYRTRPDGGRDVIETGDHRPFASRPIDYRHPVFRVTAQASGATVHYLRVRNDGAIQLPLRFWQPDAFRQALAQEHFVFGLFYGLLLVMLLYNLFLYLGVRDRAYLWYVIYVAMFGLFVLARNGFAFQWLWPDSPWLGNFSHYLLIAAAIAGAAQFTRCYLETAARAPRLDLALRASAAFSLVVAASALLGWQRAAVLLVQGHSLVTVAVGIAAAVVALKSGYAPAKYYLLAFAVLMATSVFSVARNLGAFPANFLSTYGVQIGSALEIVLLALGLADRINVLRREKEEAQQLAQHDPLTGLANRILFGDRLEKALQRARRRQGGLAVLLVDVDNFKQINDALGHDGGDAMLGAVSARLRAAVRESDTVARIGGDEFVVLLDELRDAGGCDQVAEKIVRSSTEPVPYQGAQVRVTFSIGAAVFPSDGETAAALLRQADRAMYAAKQAGRDGYRRGAG